MHGILAAAIGLASIAAAAVASAEPPAGAAACTGCHPTSPRVISRIIRALEDFRSGNRPATVMDRISKGFTDAEIQAIAAWYASQR
jgi:hypothetical protein